MNPKCYKSAILPFSGRGDRPGEISHIISSLWMFQLTGILSLLAIEAPILFQPVAHRFEDFNRISPTRYKLFDSQSPLRIRF
jgi:hypothetical protein